MRNTVTGVHAQTMLSCETTIETFTSNSLPTHSLRAPYELSSFLTAYQAHPSVIIHLLLRHRKNLLTTRPGHATWCIISILREALAQFGARLKLMAA